MMLKECVKLCSICVLSSAPFFSGCATTSVESTSTANNSTLVTPDQSQPNSPYHPVVALGATAIDSEPKPMPGTVASVLRKLEHNPLSLYWSEEHAYTYFVGEKIDAEYKPDERSLRVRDIASEKGLVCIYDDNGALRNTEGLQANRSEAKTVCSKLMLTLDDDMGD